MATSPPSADAASRDHIVLVGMMGAGKSSVGRLLSHHLGRGYLDSDEQVEHQTGHTVPEILASSGEAAFRSEESRALAEAVARPEPIVLSAAGGTVLAPENRTVLRRAGMVVWLRARPETLIARVDDGAGRPLLTPSPAEAIPRLEAVRRPLYAEVADVVIDVDELTLDEVVDKIVAVLP